MHIDHAYDARMIKLIKKLSKEFDSRTTNAHIFVELLYICIICPLTTKDNIVTFKLTKSGTGLAARAAPTSSRRAAHALCLLYRIYGTL